MSPLAKIYVAGHRGLVGSALVRNLQAKGYANLLMRTHDELDLTSQHAVDAFFATEKPEYVILAAARVVGRMRTLMGRDEFILNLLHGATAETALRKIFNYYPQVRDKVFDIAWQPGERIDALGTPWMTVDKGYRIKYGWRLLVNGNDISYGPGLEPPILPGDKMQIFPPGR